MHWKLKALALGSLDRVPFGATVYHRLQKLLRTNRLHFKEFLRRSAELVALDKKTGEVTSGEVILEVGSGWRGPSASAVRSTTGFSRTRALTFAWPKLGSTSGRWRQSAMANSPSIRILFDFSAEELAADYMWLVGQRPLACAEQPSHRESRSACSSQTP